MTMENANLEYYKNWLSERGMNVSLMERMLKKDSHPLASSWNLLFISDLPLDNDESTLLNKIGQAVKCSDFKVHYLFNSIDELNELTQEKVIEKINLLLNKNMDEYVLLGATFFNLFQKNNIEVSGHKIYLTLHPRDLLRYEGNKRILWKHMKEVMASHV